MKKKPQTLILIIVLFTFYSCSSDKKPDNGSTANESKPAEPNKSAVQELDCKTIGNFFIHKEEAEELMEHFEKTYMKKGTDDEVKGLIDSFWIDACVIKSVKEFLHKIPDYDGIRIYSTAKSRLLSNDKSNVLIVPTIPSGTTHYAIWGEQITKVPNCDPKFEDFQLSVDDAKKIRRKFEKGFRKERVEGQPNSADVDSLSRGIWFSRCVIDSLSKYLENASLGLDGVFLHCAAYKKFQPGTKQKYPNQSTFILVLTRKKGINGHENAWEVIKGLPWVKTDGGYNHGEVCPDDCPAGEN